jgi:hypothetical protein
LRSDLYDAASGLSAIVATVTNSVGAQVDAQDVVYSRALMGGGFAASVVYSLPDTASFHQDVVFVGFDPGFNPTNWGFAESSTNTLRVQIITEFYSNPPAPLMIERPLYIEQDQTSPSQHGVARCHRLHAGLRRLRVWAGANFRCVHQWKHRGRIAGGQGLCHLQWPDVLN